MDQAAKLRELLDTKVETSSFKVITVSSGKGGVGKSNFVVNLALTLNNLGKKVAILDADFGMANIDILLGINSPYNISDILSMGKSILDITVETSEGIKIIPGGSGISKLSDLSDIEEGIIIREFEKLKDIDILIIDTGAGIGKTVINFIKMADDAIIITNSEPTSITDAYGLIKVISKDKSKDKINIVVNRSLDLEEASETFNKLANTSRKFLSMNLHFLGYILEDINVRKAVKAQSPFVEIYPKSHASKCVQTIGKSLIGETYSNNNNKSIKGYISRLFGLMRG
ncbi:MAG: MinD/ParA family protein [Clostridium sp.]